MLTQLLNIQCARTRVPWEYEQEEQGWRSGDCTRLSRTWLVFDLGLAAVSGLSWLLVHYSVPRGFSPGSPVFPLLKNQHFQIPIGLFNKRSHGTIRHSGGQAYYYFPTGRPKQRQVKLHWFRFLVSMFQCGNNNELALQHGGSCSMLSFVAKGLFDRMQYLLENHFRVGGAF